MSSYFRQVLAWLVVAWLATGVTTSYAATIHHGDFGPDAPTGTMTYQDVRESSGTDPVPPARYGAPTLTGDTLDFTPSAFVATATGGELDITDGQLNFELVAAEFNNIVAGGVTSLQISEGGDYTLFGSGTATTSIVGGVSIAIDILEVDGQAITPINMFASSSITRDLANDGPVVLAPWENGLLVEFGPVLDSNNISYQFGVTKATIAIDDQLIAVSETGSVSFIAKKDFTIQPGIQTNPDFVPIPEPSSLILLATVLASAGAYRRLA